MMLLNYFILTIVRTNSRETQNFVIILSMPLKIVLFILTSLCPYYPNECRMDCLKLPLNIQQIVITMIVENSNNLPILNANLL